MGPPLGRFRNCLCLVCRQTGHVAQRCLTSTETNQAHPSPPFSPLSTVKASKEVLCQRCSKQWDALCKIPSYHPYVWKERDLKFPWRRKRKAQTYPLGRIGSLRLISTCPLCRLIFNVTHLTDDEKEIADLGGQLLVVTGWTIHRLEPNLRWKGYEEGKGQYAKCIYTAATLHWPGTDDFHTPTRPVEDATEVVGLVGGVPALGVRRVDPKTPDYRLIKGWLRRCNSLRPVTCPSASDLKDLGKIKLVDVVTRKIVIYPPEGCDYVALSYVWGDLEKPSHKLGEILPTVPAVFEDAMTVTQRLGKQYLWVDFLCIDQQDDVEKATQIALMSTIFGSAWVTIICLSGCSAQCGLPRVGTTPQDVVPQLYCEIGGKKLLSGMPTLPQQLSWSTWSSRAWTYQEGLLSPRRLFFTNHQVYFECNSMQCCESLNDFGSPFHLRSDARRQQMLRVQRILWPENLIGRGVLRDPFRPVSRDAEAQIDDDDFARYLRLMHPYTMKKMSRDADALNAFSAILTRLEQNHYRGGFVEGLPVEDLPRALLWFHPDPPRRRPDFPTWSWAGWEGEVNDAVIRGARMPNDAISPPLRIWKAGYHDYSKPTYDFNPTPYIMQELEKPPGDKEDFSDLWEGMSDLSSDVSIAVPYDSDSIEVINFGSDPVSQLAKRTSKKAPTSLSEINRDELLIEGIVIQLSFMDSPDFYTDSDSDDDGGRCSVYIEGESEPRLLRFYGHNAEQLVHERRNCQHEFLLVSRELRRKPDKGIYNALLLIDRDEDVADRVGVASLKLESAQLLDHFKAEMKLFKLR